MDDLVSDVAEIHPAETSTCMHRELAPVSGASGKSRETIFSTSSSFENSKDAISVVAHRTLFFPPQRKLTAKSVVLEQKQCIVRICARWQRAHSS